MAILKYLDKEEQDRIEKLCSEVCDKFCKYPYMFSTCIYVGDKDIDEICETCPLSEVMKIAGCCE